MNIYFIYRFHFNNWYVYTLLSHRSEMIMSRNQNADKWNQNSPKIWRKKLEYFHFWAFQFNSFFKYVWIFPVLKNDPVYIITTVKIWYRYEDIIFHLCTHLPLAYLYTLYLLSKKTRKKSGLSLPSYQLFKALWVDLGIFSFFIFMEVFK